jgi:hypothetical protein
VEGGEAEDCEVWWVAGGEGGIFGLGCGFGWVLDSFGMSIDGLERSGTVFQNQDRGYAARLTHSLTWFPPCC